MKIVFQVFLSALAVRCFAGDGLHWNDLAGDERTKIAYSIATNCYGDVRWIVAQSRADEPHRVDELSLMGLQPIAKAISYCRLTRLWRMCSFHEYDGIDDDADWCFAYGLAYDKTAGILQLGGERVAHGYSFRQDNSIVLAMVRRQGTPLKAYVERSPSHLIQTTRQKFCEDMDKMTADDFLSSHGLKDFFSRHVYRPVAGGVFRLDAAARQAVAKYHEGRYGVFDVAGAVELTDPSSSPYVTISLREMSEVVYLCQKGAAVEKLKKYDGFRKGCPLLDDMSNGAIKTGLGKEVEKALKLWNGKGQLK